MATQHAGAPQASPAGRLPWLRCPGGPLHNDRHDDCEMTWMNSLALSLSPRQLQTLSPRLQQAVRLLHLSTAEFLQTVDEALQHNPFLEGESVSLNSPDTALAEAEAEAEAEAAITAAPPDEPRPSVGWGDQAARAQRQGGTSVSALDFTASSVSLQDHLLAQLRLQRLPDRDLVLCGVLIESLDDDGYLRSPLAEAGMLAQFEPAATADELRCALRRVQALDPLGVGARDLPECLSLQLQLLPEAEDRRLCARMLAGHVSQLARLDFRHVALALGCSVERARDAFARLRRLDPHPGWRHGGAPARYVTPDVLVRRTRQGWSATLNEAVVPRIQLNRQYAQYLEHAGRTGNGALSAQLSEARFTLRNLQQRCSTILAVAQAILRRQQRFFEHGAISLQPMALRDIAEEIGAHTSTVSRVTHGKYMQTPTGTYEFKYFFSRGLETASGRSCAPQAVRSLVGEIIAAEPPSAPLSDVAIAQLLTRQGVQVARRTVTKYRQLLGIAPCEQRLRMTQSARP